MPRFSEFQPEFAPFQTPNSWDIASRWNFLRIRGGYPGGSVLYPGGSVLGPTKSSNWLRTDRGTSLNVGASTQGTSRCLGSSGAVAQGTCDRSGPTGTFIPGEGMGVGGV